MDLTSAFARHFGTLPIFQVSAPGRVNLLGEHVDYNDGPVLPIAIDRKVRLVVAPSGDDTISLYSLDMGKQVSFHLDELNKKVAIDGQELPYWARYPAGVAWSLKEAGLSVVGMKGVYTSDVPIGAGLSSSAAVEVAFAVAWQAIGGWNLDRLTLAQLCQRAENKYVGVNCGLIDQFASAFGEKDHALYFDTRSLEWEPVSLLPDTAVVIADSGVRRSLSNSAYNERRAACEDAVVLLRKYLPGIRSLRDVSVIEYAAYSEYLPPVTRRRAEHVVKEIARVHSAVRALQLEDIQSFGALMYAGHASLRDLYEVSIPELDALVEIARSLPGCRGARLTGAGFGGCTVNLVKESKAGEFVEGMVKTYQQKTGRHAEVYLCRASEGARVESV